MKPVVFALVNGGRDFNAGHLTNFLSFGRLWQNLHLDYMMIVRHAPGLSACIQSTALTGVVLANYLSGDPPPEVQSLPENALC